MANEATPVLEFESRALSEPERERAQAWQELSEQHRLRSLSWNELADEASSLGWVWCLGAFVIGVPLVVWLNPPQGSPTAVWLLLTPACGALALFALLRAWLLALERRDARRLRALVEADLAAGQVRVVGCRPQAALIGRPGPPPGARGEDGEQEPDGSLRGPCLAFLRLGPTQVLYLAPGHDLQADLDGFPGAELALSFLPQAEILVGISASGIPPQVVERSYEFAEVLADGRLEGVPAALLSFTEPKRGLVELLGDAPAEISVPWSEGAEAPGRATGPEFGGPGAGAPRGRSDP